MKFLVMLCMVNLVAGYSADLHSISISQNLPIAGYSADLHYYCIEELDETESNEDKLEVVEEEEFIVEESEELDLLYRVVTAEAGTEDSLGRAYVTDVILNLADTWNCSITEVIYHKNAFESVSNGAVNRVEPTKETKEIVKAELTDRKRHDILYFRTNYYHSFGTPVFQHGRHYFSK